MQNYNSLLHAFQSRSLWFANLLQAIFEHRPEIIEQLGENLDDLPTIPKHLRVSLAHYRFASEDDKSDPAIVWNVKPIEETRFIISKE